MRTSPPIPSVRTLVDAVLSRSSNTRSSFHGPAHWRRVASNGRAIIEETPEVDPLVVFLFALFHDSMRLNDYRDPRHGARAAALARQLRGDPYDLDDARTDLLEFALVEHDNGRISDDPTVGACWDADRLQLWRIGVRPGPALLSTQAAKKPGRIRWARQAMLAAPPRWQDLARDFGLPWGPA